MIDIKIDKLSKEPLLDRDFVLICDFCDTKLVVKLSTVVSKQFGDYIDVPQLICKKCWNAVRQEIV